MDDYTKEEAIEFDRIRADFLTAWAATHPLMDHGATVAHFAMKLLRQERGYDFKAAEARRLRARLAEIDRQVMTSDDPA